MKRKSFAEHVQAWAGVVTLVVVSVLLVLNLVGPVQAPVARSTYNVPVHIEQGGEKLVAESGGEIEVQSGGTLDVQSGATFTGDLTGDLTGNVTSAVDSENLGIPSVVSTDISYTAAAGGTGAVATIADGEIWFVHAVFVNVTTDFDCTGDDTTLVVGDGSDADGFVVLADAELQAADTEQTGSPAGWQGLVAATMGVYLDGAVSSAPHIYAPSGSAETIDWLVDEVSGETITAGAATIYVVYTRIQ